MVPPLGCEHLTVGVRARRPLSCRVRADRDNHRRVLMSSEEPDKRTPTVLAAVAACAAAGSVVVKGRIPDSSPIAMGLLLAGVAPAVGAVFMATRTVWFRLLLIGAVVLSVGVLLVVVERLPSEDVVFTEAFSDNDNRWRAAGVGTGSHRAGRYWVELESHGGGVLATFQPSVSALSKPSRLESIRIELEVLRLVDKQADAGVGILCGSGADQSYMLGIWHNRVEITKFAPQVGGYRSLKAEKRPDIDRLAPHKIAAECTKESGGRGLKLSIDDEEVLSVVDTTDPLPVGRVGIGVATGPHAQAIRARLDNFSVYTI